MKGISEKDSERDRKQSRERSELVKNIRKCGGKKCADCYKVMLN